MAYKLKETILQSMFYRKENLKKELKMIKSMKTIRYMKYSFIVLLFSIITNAAAYTMPAGIPNPDIDFAKDAPARPSDWSVEVPGYYYIDMQNGSTSVTFGSETKPRKYLPPNPIKAGSYIEIAGNYELSAGGFTRIIANGTDATWVAGQSGPVWVTQAKDKEASFVKRKVLLWGSNIFLTDFTFKEGSLLQVGSSSNGYPAKNIVAKNNELIGTLTGGTLLRVAGGSKESNTSNIILYNNIVHEAGDIESTFDQDAHVMTVGAHSSNIWVLENKGFNASGSGLQINGAPDRTSTHNIYVGKNEFYNVRQSGLWVKFAKNVVFSNNYIHNIITTPWSVSKGLGAQYEPDGLWLINNVVHDVEYGIRVASTYNVGETELKIYIIGNIIYNVHTKGDVDSVNSWQSAAIHLAGGHEHHVYNNLIFNAPNGITSSSYHHKLFIKNNIIFDLSASHQNENKGYHIWSEGNKGEDKLAIDNNYFGVELKIKLNHTVNETIPQLMTQGYLNNMTGPIAITTDDIDSITAELLTYQNLKDKGENINNILIAEYQKAFPGEGSIDLDYLNHSRTLGNTIDIGPLEQDGAIIEVTMPNKPNDIQLNILE